MRVDEGKMSVENEYLRFLDARLAFLAASDDSDSDEQTKDSNDLVRPRRKLGRALSSETCAPSTSTGKGAWFRVRQMIVKRRGRSLDRKKKSCDKHVKRDRSLGTQQQRLLDGANKTAFKPRLTITMASGQERTLGSPPVQSLSAHSAAINNQQFAFDSKNSLEQSRNKRQNNNDQVTKKSDSLPSTPIRTKDNHQGRDKAVFVYSDLDSKGSGAQHSLGGGTRDGLDQTGATSSYRLLADESSGAVKKSSGSSSTSTTESSGLFPTTEAEPASPPPKCNDNVNSRLRQAGIKPEFRRKFAEWEVRKALAGHRSSTNFDELRQLMPDDFAKKLDQWEMLNAKDELQQQRRDDDAWVAEEISRLRAQRRLLERQAKECREREHKLRRVRKSCRRRRLTIRTERGQEFTLDNLSHAFARRLYQWETENRIKPELSTLTLINTCGDDTYSMKVTRSKSEGGFELDADNRRELMASVEQTQEDLDDELDDDNDLSGLRRLCKRVLQLNDDVDELTLANLASTLERLRPSETDLDSAKQTTKDADVDIKTSFPSKEKAKTYLLQLSSSNASTPAESSLTRSSSLMSVEACSMHRLLEADDNDDDDVAEAAPDLDHICSLVQQLREQDLALHRSRISNKNARKTQ